MIRNPKNLLTPLHYASNFGHLRIVHYYGHELQCDPHVKDITDTSPVHYAAQNGQLRTTEYLANAPSSLDVRLLYNDVKHLPINSACFGGHLEIVKFLQGVNNINIDGQSCLHTAAVEGYLNITQYLIGELSLIRQQKIFAMLLLFILPPGEDILMSSPT